MLSFFFTFAEGSKAKLKMAEDKCITESEKKDSKAVEKKRKGIISRLWNGIFRLKGDDFEKRLQYISKEEAAILARVKRRSQTWRRMSRHLIIFTVVFEVLTPLSLSLGILDKVHTIHCFFPL